MNDCTFLIKKQTIGNSQIDILRKYGTMCATTDFAILLGGYVSSNFYADECLSLKDRTGIWWTKSIGRNEEAFDFNEDGYDNLDSIYDRTTGARPVLTYSLIRALVTNKAKVVNGIKEIEYGEYPQTAVDENTANELEKMYNMGSLRITGKKYTTDSASWNDYNTSFTERIHTEYKYNINKYIRFVADSNNDDELLSNGRRIQVGKVYWIRVEPIVWLVDEKADIVLAKKILFAGVQFADVKDNTRNFKKMRMYRFMNTYFAKEILTDKSCLQTKDIKSKDKIQNPYNLNFAEVSEEDIIKGAVESNIAVFLHGRSSEGKSARVKQLDPNCEIIYLRNATPDSLNGKSVYVPPLTKKVAIPVKKTVISNERTEQKVIDEYEYTDVIVKEGYMLDVKPSWLMKLEEKCEFEPDKIHIVFFDELTNALPSIQGMAFNIILEREVNGKWKLPANARIVAAGNDLNDSLAANEMAEPLFNRFAHVYIHTTVDNWLKWAITPNEVYVRLEYKKEKLEKKIHPAIYAYIAYKSHSGQDVLRTPYTGEKPNADPRKWEMASKVLYKTNQPEMLRALIGEELTTDFIAFVKEQVITVKDVINHNYTRKDLEMDISQKFATAVGLSSVDEEHFEIVRDFMKKVGSEPRAVFEAMWVNGDENRLEYLKELQIKNNLFLERRK